MASGFILAASFAVMLLNVSESMLEKYIATKMERYAFSLSILAIGILPMIAAAFLIHIGTINYAAIAIAIASGLFLGAGYPLFYRSMEKEQVTKVSSLTEIQPTIIVIAGLLVFGEKVSLYHGIGIALIFVGVAMLIAEERMKINKNLLPAVMANVCWGLYWVIIAFSISYGLTFVAALITARMTAAVMTYYHSYKSSKLPKIRAFIRLLATKGLMYALAVVGIIDGFVNLIFGFVTASNYLAVGGSILAIAPLFVAMLGAIIYRDRLGALQLAGLFVVIIGSVIITIG